MADNSDVALMSHLMRRAGFGATRDDIEALVDQGYEATVDQLLDPDSQPDIDEALLFRYHPMAELIYTLPHAQMNWLYRMVNTGRPLREKMALFWHHVFATGNDKVTDAFAMHSQIEMFREHGTGNYRDLLVRLAKNPAMIYWLDNQDNHKRAPNENWGRELLELFALGVGNYTEKDVFECARAFTGWTFTGKASGIQLGPIPWRFDYRGEDHDEGEKTFLGETGNFNGEDIVDIVVRQPACPQFITRHLYNFFVADEPEVPKWPNDPPLDPDAIAQLSEVFVESNYEITPVLKTLFNSDFFKESAYHKVRSPAETVVGTLKVTGDLSDPDPRWGDMAEKPASMGQDLMNPPSVEGWHTGREWINSGALINRVNFAADRLGNPDLPGVAAITRRVGSNGPTMSAEELVDRCLDEMGPLTVDAETHGELVERVSAGGPITRKPGDEDRQFSQRVCDLLAMIAGTKEFLFT
jgi:hypothetical protein